MTDAEDPTTPPRPAPVSRQQRAADRRMRSAMKLREQLGSVDYELARARARAARAKRRHAPSRHDRAATLFDDLPDAS